MEYKILYQVQSKKYRILSLIIALFALYHLDIINSSLSFLENGYVAEENRKYLSLVELEASEVLLVLYGIKSLLMVVESSIVGISFVVEAKLQIGKSVRILLDMLNYIQIGAILSLASSSIIEVLLGISKMFSNIVVGASIISLYVYYIWQGPYSKFKKIIGKISFLLTFFALLVNIMLPLSVHFAHIVSKKLLRPHIEQTYVKLKETHNVIKDSSNKESDIHEHVKHTIHNARELSNKVEHYNNSLSKYIIKYLIYKIFETLIFPITIILVMVIASRRLLCYLIFRD